MSIGRFATMVVVLALPALLGDLIPQAIRQGPSPRLPWRETAVALAMLSLATVPTLARLRNVSPMALLREGPGPGQGHPALQFQLFER